MHWEKYERFQDDENSDTDTSDSEDESDSDNENYHMTTTSKKSSPMTKLDFFKKCRLVCKGWKSTVDNHFQGPTLCPIALHTKIITNQKEYHRFNSLLQHCLKDDISPSWNPFPNRELTMFDEDNFSNSDDEDDENEEFIGLPPYISIFQKNIEKFLNKFGHHLKIFSHYGRHQQQYQGSSHWYSTIRRWIDRMPNLEILSLVYVERDDRYIMSGSLIQAVRLNPFPKLEKLNTLHMEDTFLPALHSAVESNHHVEKLLINRHSCQLPWLTMGSIPLNNLTTFYARLVSMAEFNQLEHLNSPLKMVKVQILPSFEEEIDILKCFKVLERFRETLTFIDFTVPSTVFFNEREFEGENLAENPRQTTLLTLLAPFAWLEHVAISPFNMGIFHRRFRDRGFVMKFRVWSLGEYLDDWLVSPLWSQLPNLKRVILKDVEPMTSCHYASDVFAYSRPD